MQVDEELNNIVKQHNTLVQCYKETISIKKGYLAEISEEIVVKKIELANQIYANLERLHKKAKSCQFSTADLMGIEKVDVLMLNTRTLEEIDVRSFNSLNDELLQYLVSLVQERRIFQVKLRLLDLKNYANKYQNRDSFYENRSKDSGRHNRSFIMRSENSGSVEDETLSTDGTPTPRSQSVEGYERILILKGPKKIKREVQNRLSFTYVPNNLKYSVYNCIIENNNSIDFVFFDYYNKIDTRMPRHIEDIISDNVKTSFCVFNYFNANLEDQVMQTLKIFYNYRPDIGYKPGMELYAITLGINMSGEKLLRIFVSLLLDTEILLAVYKGIDSHLIKFLNQVHARLNKFKRNDLTNSKELIDQFFAYSVSTFFSYTFTLGSLKKLMDIFVAFGSKALILLFVEILFYVELKDLQTAQNCYHLEKVVASKIKNVCETKILKNVIDNLKII